MAGGGTGGQCSIRRRPAAPRYDVLAYPDGRRALALRAPILRHVYNEMPEVRSAIDKVAATLSQGLMTVGGSSEQIGAYAGTFSTSAPPGPTWLTWHATRSFAGTVICRSGRCRMRTSGCCAGEGDRPGG